jgi:hypothetical protein
MLSPQERGFPRERLIFPSKSLNSLEILMPKMSSFCHTEALARLGGQ